MLLVIAAILTVAMGYQYLNDEIPCPLCLPQRVALFGVCFGIIQNFRNGYSDRNTGWSLLVQSAAPDHLGAADLAQHLSAAGARLCRQRCVRHSHAGLVR